ncbi:dynein heavy chain 1, axonemal-like [Agrilus planipennis]|uniref:Dynein heavy chain 1, axonemal-like n=1 Tax=Agrilus planipennis TaxID=224129 RepID=A0A1W4X6Z1_AGRPL|nr:dynein heavy chain 1, axonemal-like [Agrilus planipennis]
MDSDKKSKTRRSSFVIHSDREAPKKLKKECKRGYYSELITDLSTKRSGYEGLPGVYKHTTLLWQIRTEKQSPIIALQPVAKPPNFLAPAERWMHYKEEKDIAFPFETFKPKVQMQHEVPPKCLPRNVAIERKRRQYQASDLKEHLFDLNVKYEDLLPIGDYKTLLVDENFSLYNTVNYLPLELFDDEEYDCRSPDSWLKHGVLDGIQHPLPGLGFVTLPSEINNDVIGEGVSQEYTVFYGWVNVAIMDYVPQKKHWKVLTLDGLQRTFVLPRIYLMFRAEDPQVFAQRIRAAIDLRNDVENKIRYEFYLDCMAVTGLYDIEDTVMEQVYKSATRGRPVKISDKEILETFEVQARLCHKRALAELQFRQNVKKDPDVYNFFTLPEIDPIKGPREKIITGMDNFEEAREYFRWMSIWVIPETYRAMSLVVEKCLEAERLLLFVTSHGGKAIKIEDFEAIQIQATTNCMKFLKGAWLESITHNIRMCLGDVGKGWFDVNEKIPRTYDIAKLIRFMENVKHRMQYSIRMLARNSTNMFVNLVETPCQCCLHVEPDFDWGEDLVNTQFKPTGAALFYQLLKMDDKGPYYSTPVETFPQILLQLYDTAVELTHTIPQVHPFLLKFLKYPPDLYLSSLGLLEEGISTLRERMLTGYEKATIPLLAYADKYYAHKELYNMDVPKYIEMYKEEQHAPFEYKEDLIYHYKMKDNLEVTIPANIVIGPFYINVEPLKKVLITKREDIIAKLLDQLTSKMKACIEEVLDEYKALNFRLLEKPTSIEHIYEIRDWMETIPLTVRQLEETTKRYLMEYDILDYFWYALPQEDFENKWEAIGWPLKISQQIEATNEFLEEETDKFRKIQLDEELALEERIEGFTVQVAQLSGQRDFTRAHEVAIEIKRLWKNMKEAQEQGLLLNSRQKLFNMPVVPFDNLVALMKEFEPYKNLWVTASDWMKWHEIWMDNPLVNIDGEAIEPTMADMYKIMQKSIRIFADIEAVQTVAMRIRDEMDEFRPMVPLLKALRNPGMRQRHWDHISEETGLNIVWTPTLTFNDFLAIGIDLHADLVLHIADIASKEYSIETILDKMQHEWENIDLELQPYKDSGTFIVRVSDETQQMLDDHIVMTQQISFSPFKGAFEERIDEWELTLKLTSQVVETWIELQKTWMYIEPIFTSEDIKLQLPIESKKYSSMERTWRRIMRNAQINPKMISYCADQKLLESLRDCVHLLDLVQKGLAEYLEFKRMTFPRLFFLSDDELLEILSQARNPLAVQPHLRKCFENIARLTFEADLKITQMFSAEDECVDLDPPLYPEGGVEIWLVVVENSMKNTLRTTFGKSLEDLYKKDRKSWVLLWPGQIVIACCQTYWTTGVEAGIAEGRLARFFDIMLDNLDQLRQLVRGTLTYLHREIICALIVIEVHARDVTQSLVTSKVSNVNDFDWISQLRYYWIEQEVKVRAVNAEFQYGYEYLGNSGRLVITPLTDRCYLTLTGALHLKFGGAPAGPAGTGKTETTKDLGKAMAIQCVVFNCSDQLDFMAMGKFFKGLASSGAWACFDEFNRIDIEVLSVVAQQIMTIQKAQQSRLDRFFFEGVEIALKASCAVFITMNPGYAGRTELPDNLKALFRPVAMMVPDYTLIAEISLFSFGFGNAKKLANKITTTFKLSSEQLSSQDHYDFGMRAVKTVIAVAGNLKRERPQMEENQICLRALRDVNVPKFLKDDLKLFNGIVSDLFPRMVEEVVDYGILEESIRTQTKKKGLEDVDEYVKKVIQLYETTVVRHGLMLVGPTGSGKTKCYEILKAAMTALKGKPQPSGYPFQPVWTYVLNPKSITMGQLYGEFDLVTHEWTDGILPSLVRIGVSAENKDKRWYVFDGPVDAVWIENMNTVLDDNKKLCLSSGEIIKLRDTQTMMFEVADLAVASPATVSRCGMVYLEPGVLGLQPFLNCWIDRLPLLAIKFADEFQELFQIYLLPAIVILRSNMKEVLTSVDSALVISFLRLMDFRLGPLAGKDNKPPPPAQFIELIPVLLVPWVVFSVIWSIGVTCDNDGRVFFSDWIRETMVENNHAPLFPAKGLVYDYKLHDGGFTDVTEENEPIPPAWHNWMENMEEYKITIEMRFSDIEVPTIDKVRNAEMIGILLNNEDNVLCVGPTGTGKTITIISKLSRNMHKKYICDFICFSARTSANQTQDLIDGKLDRRRRGVFGPPVLKRQIFFIDDFNMPALEVYGAQPPIELIRQWMDFEGWYDRRNIGEFRTIIDTNFICAMGPPGGGRNPVTARLLRHFHYLTFTELEDDSKITIFGTILKFWINRTTEFAFFYEILLRQTMYVYSTILRELLPTPAKTHYTFNLRDLGKTFQGILMMNPESVTSLSDIVRLWYHENCRVFQDRLINDTDRQWFDNLLRDIIKKQFQMDDKRIIGNEVMFYGDFMDSTSDDRAYIHIKEVDKMNKALLKYLDEFNNQTTKPMKLVLFEDAMAHICRVARIIRQPLGNGLLLGMGGSGRQSLTRLAAFIAEYTCFQIELTKTYGNMEWRDDIKNLMLKSGLQNAETVFLFSDTQVKTESFLEDINNILNSGDVPNIYAPDELDKIYQGMRTLVQEMGLSATKSNLYSVYTRQVRVNLHTVITMSPIGEVFRARLRQFPALVNCCTIDWYSEWPDSALQSVALQFLEEIEELNVSNEVLNGIVVVCQYMHASVVKASVLYKQELSRHNYVTPASYLGLLSSYTDLMNTKKGNLTEGVGRLKIGLEKMRITGEEVKVLQVDLALMKPALELAAKDAEVMIAQIAQDTLVAEETKAVVEKEEFEATKKAIETETIAADAQRDLEEAMPALEAAEASLKSLNKNDITEVRAMKKPPAGVIYVMEAICIVKNVKPIKVPGSRLGEKILDYWEPGRGLLTDPGAFLNSLMNFDKDSITEEMIQKLKHYVEDPQFQPAKIIKVSKACTSLCMWVHAMYKYYFVNLVVAPKKAALAKAKEELAITERQLAIAREKMKEVMDNLDLLNAKLNEKLEFKAEQERNINLCQDRMNRAVRLISGLAGERVRWIQTIANIESSVVNVTGDILISSGSIAYLAPFVDSYRRRLLGEWFQILIAQKVPHTPNCTPVAVLGEPVVIRQWQIDGLPRDYFSTENAILAANSRRWPLFIDPQGQANKWIKNMGKPKGISACKLADRDLLRTLESAIRFGKAVVIENVGTELDPALDTVLLKQLFKQGSTWVIKLGDIILPYNFDFELYITTKLPNPHYSPEICVKVLLVNFTLVPSGLEDQLLGLVVAQERPDLEEQRSAIVVSTAQMKQELKEIEDRILYKLSISEGSPVDDIDFIVTLEASKVKSEEIKSSLESAEITQIDIDNTRMQYIPVARRGQILFFCVADLSNVDPMYQYSLEWFINIFSNSMAEAEKSDILMERVGSINDVFTFSLYSNVCRSLFEKHKLLFAFLLCIRIMMEQNKINAHEWHFFLAGGSPLQEEPNPASDWLSEKAWKEIMSLRNLHNYQKFVDTFQANIATYKAIFESIEPHREKLPPSLESSFDDFQRMLILKSLRPDKVTNAMQDFLTEHIGQQFVEPQTADLAAMFKEASPTVPLIFVISAGTDPAADLYKFADKMKMAKRMFSISLGQGQGPRAEEMIHSGKEVGTWVFFQNCHLAPSWMPRLDRLVETINPDAVHRDFRMWLTSTPSDCFPVSILQNGSKMTVEPPRGLKANMLRAYSNQVVDVADFFHSEHPKCLTFRYLLFSLCFFHGITLERRKFGPLGFNIPYEFTDGDLKICISQLLMFLLEYEEIPFKVLLYTAGHINYGGRVTDDWDRRCLMNILQGHYRTEVIDTNFCFDEGGIYRQLPPDNTLQEYLGYIKKLPLNDDPEFFGLHQNADISCAQANTYFALATLLLLQPKQVGGSASSQEEETEKMAKSILGELPSVFDLQYISKRYPVLYEESLNTVLSQEAIRYNKLLNVIKQTLVDLLKALKGLVVMSEVLEKMSASLFRNAVPQIWASKAYPSLKPLGAWIKDLHMRVAFIQLWIDQGIPTVFWISGFYFPQAFLTGTLQNFARRYVLSIDTISFMYRVLKEPPKIRPADGACIRGLFLEGSRWNPQKMTLDESRPKELYTDMPVIWMIPEEFHQKPKGVYICPVYKTLTRAGTLSTTGHSTNYVVAIEVPSQKSEQHWIKRGVALICALDY